MFGVSIILCVVFFVSAKSEPVWVTPALEYRKMALEAITEKIDEFGRKLNGTRYQKRCDETTAELTKFSEAVAEKDGLTHFEVDNAYSTLTDEAKGIDITECSNHYNLLKGKINVILSQSLECLQNSFKGLSNNIMTIEKMVMHRHSRFNDVEQRIKNCNAHIVNQASAIAAMDCSSKAKKDADDMSSELGRRLISKISMLDKFLNDVHENLKICTDGAGLRTIDSTVSAGLKMIKKCIEQTIEEAREDKQKNFHGNEENKA